jgi:methionyl aminopeptidase
MTLSSDEDLIALQKIGRIVALTLQLMKDNLQPGMTTAELDEIGAKFLKEHGARSAPILAYNFPGATCISLNDEAAHGIPGERVIQPGDLVNIDVSAELDGYWADTAATIPVPPTTALQRRLCDSARRAQQRAMHAARTGRRINVIGQAAETEAQRGGFNIIRNLTSHGVGRHIHEDPTVPNFAFKQAGPHLTEGLVVTIEPFLTNGNGQILTGDDGWTLRTTDGSFSAQYEHTIVVTKNKPIIITAL